MNSGTAELYLIVGYMTLILLIAFTAVYIFFRQYKREMKSKNEAKKKKAQEQRSENR
jgi:flagellar biosynthesis/type III secretory pathway M-ring protein FliF/YscJ